MNSFQRSIVVTGGAGLIGSALICELNIRGYDNILVVDRLDRSEKWRNLVPLRYRDYADADDFEHLVRAESRNLADVGLVFHLGACSSTTETDAAYLMRNNYEYTKTLGEWALRNNVRFVYASSAATYGARERDLRDDADLDALRPLNMYAYSKHRFDVYARDNGWLRSMTGVKYFNIFGPNENHKGDMRSLVHKAFHQIRECGSIQLFRSHRQDYRDGEQQRDFLYVKDAVNMTIHLAEREAYGIYNVGSGRAHTWLDLVRPIFEALGIPEKIEFIDMPATLRDKYQYCTLASMERFRATQYDGCTTPLRDAVHDYVTNYLVPDRRLEPVAGQWEAARAPA